MLTANSITFVVMSVVYSLHRSIPTLAMMILLGSSLLSAASGSLICEETS
jgi:hypothetical protein